MATPLTRADAAAGAGVEPAYVDRAVELGIIRPAGGDEFTIGDVRRLGMLRALQEAGLSLEGIAAGIERGLVSLDFADSPSYARFAALGRESFEEVSARTGVPFELLVVLRETIGLGTPQPSDRIRDDELAVVPFLAAQVRLGFRTSAITRLLSAQLDSLRRIAEAEAEWYRAEVVAPLMERGGDINDIATLGTRSELDESLDRTILALYHSQQAQTWMANIVAGFEEILGRAGLHDASERPPAICFLDITGYTRLTQERGDRAAAALAEDLARLVKRSASEHQGRAVKWLGDGVMFYFREPLSGVLAALEMVEGIVAAGLPPAHVGLHAGPIVMQEGDYYGQTVNMAARIADYARPGEVLVSEAVVVAAAPAAGAPASATDGLEFAAIGDVELKGVSGPVRLHAARRAGRVRA